MPVRVAIASRDGKVVHQHFGRATQFLIFEIEGQDFRLAETRPNVPACQAGLNEPPGGHDPDRMERSIACVADCQAVLVAQIGPAAQDRLAAHGIRAYIVRDFIDDALRDLIAQGDLDLPPQDSLTSKGSSSHA